MTEQQKARADQAPPDYQAIARHYEACLSRHGPTHRGVDWPNAADLALRFDVMLGVMGQGAVVRPNVLDLGCGPGLLLDHLKERGRLDMIDYRGLDISAPMIEAARARWPGLEFERRDILVDPLPGQSVDYAIANGVLTEKVNLSQAAMVEFAQRFIAAAFAACRAGFAFNVMSHHVDRRRDDLFHWPFDEAAAFLVRHCSRHFVLRADYGLYEYTIYVYRDANRR